MPFSKKMPRWKLKKAREMRKNPTPAERVIWGRVRNRGLEFKIRRQVPILGYIVDFYCPLRKLIIEIDGKAHEKTISKDTARENNLTNAGLRVIRFTNKEVLCDLGWVIKEIKKSLGSF